MIEAFARATSLDAPSAFPDRHIGPRGDELKTMLELLGYSDLDAFIEAVIPAAIRTSRPLDLPRAVSEAELLDEMAALAGCNRLMHSFIGMGYNGTYLPAVIQRNILENPGWYTQYTPYQAEIAQGRLEALLNFQTMIMDLTGLDIANASVLDEATAAAEAMMMCLRVSGAQGEVRFLVASDCHPQTIDVVRGRAEPLGIAVEVGDPADWRIDTSVFGVLVQYPSTDGVVRNFEELCEDAHTAGAYVIVAADPLALTLLRPPGDFGADVAVGSTQRFGVPMGFGGPHAGYMAARDEFKRQLPGRLIGVSHDADERPALRLALQTREQHIRRDRATSNICTAQVLLAVIASMYAVYHGPEGLANIARRVRRMALVLGRGLDALGCEVSDETRFDTLTIDPGATGRSRDEVVAAARALGIGLRSLADGRVGISLDETTTAADLCDIVEAFGGAPGDFDPDAEASSIDEAIPSPHARTSDYLTHPIFNTYRSETEMQRYMRRLEARDLSLTTSMIPLGSCTMKLNAAAEMLSITLPGFSNIHPFAPAEDVEGYRTLIDRLEAWLAEITGFDAFSVQPNAGSQGEYAGLLVIRAHHRARGDDQRDVCLIPTSAHGTNPASAVMAGMRVVPIATDEGGNVDMADLQAKIDLQGDRLAALMITYPSTHGVFEPTIKSICDAVHAGGGQVYLDGANLNAMVGLCRPAELGADVCHLNLHKTFCIPHGGGGPGVGPIGVAAHLAPYLPGHGVVSDVGGEQAILPVTSAPWGSASILPISYAYVAMMGPDGLKKASEIAVLNANYIAERLAPHYPVLYRGPNNRVAHECIIDLRQLRDSANIEPDDVAKRLMDYGFHAPTMSWPVAGTLMIEPTESENLAELDRFCNAMIAIRKEIRAIERGTADRVDNPLKNAPHTARAVMADDWRHPYSRSEAAYPAPWLHDHKFWPPVARIDNAYGDRNIVCSCPPMEAYADMVGEGDR